MKIVTWNCFSRFDDKAHLIHEMRPDLAVIQECAKKDAAALECEGYSALWFGTNEKKGVAVLAASPWKIEQIAPPENTWIVPIQVSGPVRFVLLAVWAWHETNQRYAGYVDQVYEALSSHPEWFDHGPVVAAGDFNSSAEFDRHIKGNNHSSIVSLFEKRGMTSAYHQFYSEKQGDEKVHTFHHNWDRGNPFHIDYIFIPNEWRSKLDSMQVGGVEDWITQSDHCPLVANFVPFDPVVPV